MAKKEDFIDMSNEREDEEDVLRQTDSYRKKLKDNYDKTKEELKMYSDKAKIKIHKKPFESLGIAAGTGLAIGVTIGILTAFGVKSYNGSNNNKYKLSKKNMQSWSNAFEDDIKEKPIHSIGIALGAGLLLGMMAGRKKWD